MNKILIKLSRFLLHRVDYSGQNNKTISCFNDMLQAKDAEANDLAYHMINENPQFQTGGKILPSVSNYNLCLLHLSLENSTSNSDIRRRLRGMVNNSIGTIEFFDRMILIQQVYRENYNN